MGGTPILAELYEFLRDCKINTAQYVQYHAAQNSKRAAVVSPQFTLTYGDLVQLIEGLAHRLQAMGVRPGSQVELTPDNLPVALILSLALHRLGATCVIPFSASQSGAVPSEFYIDDKVVEGRIGQPLVYSPEWMATRPGNYQNSVLPNGYATIDSIVVITTSTGTTGRPKAVASTVEKLHRSILSSLQHPGQAAGKAPCLVVASFGSLWAYRQMLTVLWSGGTLVLGPVHPSTASALKTLRVRHLATPVGRLVDWLKIARKNPRLFDGLEAVTTAGAMLTPALEREVQTYICKQVFTNYGTTETGLIASGNSAQRSKYPHCVGSIVPGAKLEVVDENNQPMPEGQTGRVRIWIGESKDTLGGTVIRDGWFYPGDTGSIVEGNVLCLQGRTDDIVNLGGRKYVLDALDDQLVGCKGIVDHGVFAVPDRLGVVRLYCAVCPGDGYDPAIVENSLKDTPPLAKIFEMKQIPRTTDGKIKRHELVALVTGPQSQS
jgi:acyl-coenzyme A synthetase/AMP-(fatty) acid ligase